MAISDVLEFNARKETLTILKRLHGKGYKYVVRENDSVYLLCFSLKPKRYRDTGFWGYINPREQGVMGASPIKNTDITEINWTNKSATLISDFLTKEGLHDCRAEKGSG